jgi:hypothetical protein
MFVIRFRDSRMAVCRRRTEHAAWRAAELHQVPMHSLECVTEAQHEADKGDVPEMPTFHLNKTRRAA